MSDYISTQYLSSSLRLSVMRMQTELSTAQNEATTGEYSDVGLHLGAQAGQEISLQNENGLLQTYTTTNSAVATSLSTTTSALDTLRTNAQNTLNNLTEWAQDTDSGTQLQNLGANGLQSHRRRRSNRLSKPAHPTAACKKCPSAISNRRNADNSAVP